MIRPANKFDLPELRQMMREFRSESPVSFLHDIDNEQHFDALMMRVFAGAGVCFIEQGKGAIIGVVFPSIWCDKTLVLSELAWYVRPEHRGGTVGYRLLKSYMNAAEQMKAEGRIKAFTMAKMTSSPDINYGRFGFKKLEESWIHE